MKSRASFKSHPLHPMLIPIPIGFLVGALLLNVLGLIWNAPAWWSTAQLLAGLGIVAGLIAAVPGFIDYLYTVPPESSGKTRAVKHAIANVAALVLFGIALALRGDLEVPPGAVVIGLQVAGAACLGAGGWMGGTLVYRNVIGVDMRYAGAGKWSETQISADLSEAEVARADELEVDQMKLIRVNGHRIVLGRTEAGYVAFDDRCPHRGGSLAGGMMICGTVQCPWHGSQFDVSAGTLKAGPAEEGIRTFPTEVRDGKVYVRTEGAAAAKSD
jgi:nitrite reductase/ring-hydroxylating ferredoxin subunit/uncharacterized membrane protein